MTDDSTVQAFFVERARHVQPQFAPTATDEAAIRDICRLVDGLPLGIELAASWVALLSCAAIAERTRASLGFLVAAARNTPQRHRSLRALLDQSWAQLTSVEQDAMMALSIFRNGWEWDQAELITQVGLDTLRRLVERSLVRAVQEGRYDMHELTRQYAGEQLEASGRLTEVTQRHLDVFANWLDQVQPQLYGQASMHWFHRFELANADLRAAWDYAIATRKLPALDRMLNSLYEYWLRRSYWQEGAQWLERRLSLDEGAVTPSRAWALLLCANLCGIRGQTIEAVRLMQEAAPMMMQVSDPMVQAVFFNTLSLVFFNTLSLVSIDLSQKLVYVKQSIALFKQLDFVFGWATSLLLRGDALRNHGLLEAAQADYEESLHLYESIGNVDFVVYPKGNLGRLALLQGDVVRAHELFAECVEQARASGSPHLEADWLLRLGITTSYLADLARAELLLLDCFRLTEQMGNWRTAPSVATWLAHIAISRGNLAGAEIWLQRAVLSCLRYARIDAEHLPVVADDLLHLLPDMIETIAAAARLATAQEKTAEAAYLLAALQAAQAACGYQLEPPLAAAIEQLRQQVGDEPDARAGLQQGAAASMDKVVALMLALCPRHP